MKARRSGPCRSGRNPSPPSGARPRTSRRRWPCRPRCRAFVGRGRGKDRGREEECRGAKPPCPVSGTHRLAKAFHGWHGRCRRHRGRNRRAVAPGSPCSTKWSGRPSCSTGTSTPWAASDSRTAEPAPPSTDVLLDRDDELVGGGEPEARARRRAASRSACWPRWRSAPSPASSAGLQHRAEGEDRDPAALAADLALADGQRLHLPAATSTPGPAPRG